MDAIEINNQINNIKKDCSINLESYYYLPRPPNIQFYALLDNDYYIILTNEEMDQYFSKYQKWKEYFVPYLHKFYFKSHIGTTEYINSDMKGLYVVNLDQINNFLVSKYTNKKLEEKLGKV